MFRAEARGETVELHDDHAGSHVALVPGRGAIVTRFRVAERELLYLDESTLHDPTKNVRGGVPLLFPSPGRLTGDRFERQGRSGSMKQHGFARDLAWQADARADGDAARAILTASSSDATRAMYPWDFRLMLVVALSGPCLRLDLAVENTGTDPMPFAFGVHPYLRVAAADKGKTRVETRATRAFDNTTKQIVSFQGFDLTAKEVDMHLLDHNDSESALDWPDGGHLDLQASPELSRWVVWTLAERDFVCVEPWTSPADALNTGDSLLQVDPGDSHHLWVALTYQPSLHPARVA